MTYRINVAFDPDGTRRAEHEVEPASEDEAGSARATWEATLAGICGLRQRMVKLGETRPSD